jgi:hypothetical protein
MPVALMLSSGIAHADGDDFLRALHQQGIKDSGGDQAISARIPVISWRATWR